MFHQCQTAFPLSTKIPSFTFQHFFFFLNFRLYLFASEVHSLTGVSPCHCDQVRVTGHGLSSLIVKFLIFIFFSGLGIVSWYHSFLKTTYFSSSISDCTCNQLGHDHYMLTSSKSHFWPLSKVLFPEFQFFHFSEIIFGCSTFWLTLHVPP